MAVREGRCRNCGSIILVDSKKDQAHCLFCNAVFPKEEAFAIMENPDGYDFPNEEQPEYTGPELSPNSAPTKVNFAANKVTSSAKQTKSPAKYEVKSKQLPDMKLSKKQLLLTLLPILVLLVALVAILLPRNMSMSQDKQKIIEAFEARVAGQKELQTFQIKASENFDVQRIDNSYVVMVADQASKDQALAICEEFCQARAEVLGLDQSKPEELYADISFKLATKTAAYTIHVPADQAGGSLADFLQVQQ